ncbi:MAG: DedA family protein [Patescibacteria group bacterium]|nr:DedA family protein [Patescibacteria group bacterium]
MLTDPRALIAALGMTGVIIAVFAETGLFVGFFLPGDSLLFTAGFLASQGYMPVGWLFIGAFAAAVAGDALGYAFGAKAGPALFVKDDSLFFDRKHIARAEHFYERYGKKAVILARFVPIVRTFAPIVAGIGSMRYRTFLTFNVIGGLAWTALMVFSGYGLGSVIPDPDRYVMPAVALIVIVSVIPVIREALLRRRGDR